jgi:hypothetical protein
MKRFGCLVTSVSMATAWFQRFVPNIFKTPKELAKLLRFDAAGNLQWPSLVRIGLKLKARVNWKDDVAFAEALKNPKTVLILQLNKGAHFVLALQKVGAWYRTADPNGGKVKWYCASITGGRIITLAN